MTTGLWGLLPGGFLIYASARSGVHNRGRVRARVRGRVWGRGRGRSRARVRVRGRARGRCRGRRCSVDSVPHCSCVMAVREQGPPRLGAFLNWGVDAGILRVSGVAYQFRHQQLQDWFTSAAAGTGTSPAQAAQLILSGDLGRCGIHCTIPEKANRSPTAPTTGIPQLHGGPTTPAGHWDPVPTACIWRTPARPRRRP